MGEENKTSATMRWLAGRHRAQLLWRNHRARLWAAAAFFLSVFLILTTRRIPHSPDHHLFADMRNLLGVPNTLNVVTSFPFLLVGVPGLVLCLSGACFRISLKGETWGWALFYLGTAATAFGSAYYHLKPDDDRVVWDNFPMMISAASILSNLVIERIDERKGISCLISLLLFTLLSTACERTFNDLRLYVIFHFVPSIAIPALIFLFDPKYTHSRYWFVATGFFILSRFEAIADRRLYNLSHYVISGHSLEHVCLALVPMILTLMLWLRSVKIPRDS